MEEHNPAVAEEEHASPSNDPPEDDVTETEASSTPQAPESRVLAGAEERLDSHSVWRGYIETFDGKHLYFVRWSHDEAEHSSRPVIALMHGYAEHVERYHEFAARLVAAGYPVCGIDARGHGQSDGKRGFIERFDDYVLDLRTLFAHIHLRYGDRPVVLFGHSNGGLVAIQFALAHGKDLAALVLSGPSLGLALQVPAWKSLLGKAASRFYPTLSLPTEIAPTDVSRAPDTVSEYGNDPLVNHIATARFFTEMTAAHESSLARASEITLPFTVYQGGTDKLTSVEATRRFYDATGSSDRTFNIYPDHYHEIFFEPDRAEITAHLIAWLDERFAQ